MQVYTTRPLSFAHRVTAHLALATTLLLAGCGGHSGSDPAQPQVKAQRLEAAANGGNADVAMNVPYANFTVSNNGDSYVVTDNVGNAGSQTFARGTRLDFTDVNVELDSDGPAAQIYRLYQAAFNRQADLPGLGFWLDFVDHGTSMVDVAAGFMQSPEFVGLYGTDPTPQTLVTKLYANVLHRAPDPAGYQFWLDILARGTSPAQVLIWFSESAENRAQMAPQVANGVAYVPLAPKPGVYLLAGDGVSGGNSDGTGAQASFASPNGLLIDGAGNLYTSDTYNNRIRKITPQGQVSTLAGGSVLADTVDGTGTAARFSYPLGITADGAGNLYVLDRSGSLVRKVTPAGVVSSYAGCFPVAGSSGCDPQHVALPYATRTIVADKAGVLYVAGAQGIARIDSAGKMTTFAGNTGYPSYSAPGDATHFHNISGLVFDGNGNLYVADGGGATILKVAPSGSWTVVAGASGLSGTVDGDASTGRLQAPSAMAFDSDGTLYIADVNAIRKLSPAGKLSTVSGLLPWGAADGPALQARFRRPNGLVVDAAHNVYIADTNNNAIRVLSAAGVVSTFAGRLPADASIDGSGSQARFTSVDSLAVNSKGTIIVADNGSIREISPANQVSTLTLTQINPYTGLPFSSGALLGQIGGIAIDASDNIITSDGSSAAINKISPTGVVSWYSLSLLSNVYHSMQGPSQPAGMAFDSKGQLFVADIGNGFVHNLGNGGSVTDLPAPYAPIDVAFDPSGNMYVAVPYSNLIGMAPAATLAFTGAGYGSGAAGYADGSGSAASFNGPSALAVDPVGNIYVADTSNHLIRKITPDGTVTTVAGTREQSGTKAGSLPGVLFQPTAIKVIGMKTLIVSSGSNVMKIVLP